MKKLVMIGIFVAVLCVSTVTTKAAVFGDGGAALQQVLNNITTNPVGNSSVDVVNDALSDDEDSYWAIGGTGGSVSTVVIELADFANDNTFGIYDKGDPSKTVMVFDGAATTGTKALLSIYDNGDVELNFNLTGVTFSGNQFGFYLENPVNPDNPQDVSYIWYSDSTLNNDDDHMYAYQGENDTVKIGGAAPGLWTPSEYVLAWEDLPFSNSDKDFTDFVVMVESVNPVPVPGAILLGFLGMSAAGLKLRRFA